MLPLPLISMLLVLCFSANSKALECKSSGANPITVDQSGKGKFRKIQDAINSIPSGNTQWKHIRVSSGVYREKVTIPPNKPCIFLEGGGRESTVVEWNAHMDTETSVTFNSFADSFVAKRITFKNTYGLESNKQTKITQAVAMRVRGDKSAFFDCGFVGLQDTLWDVKQRHFFHNCYIEGAMDFIFGDGQSIYENCLINVTAGDYLHDLSRGYITAQKRNSGSESSGFVFKSCKIFGRGKAKAFLGRAWGAYSRVIFYNSEISDVIAPEGWSAWNYAGGEGKITYAEVGCRGGGADTRKRVAWQKKLSVGEIRQFVETSYIDEEDGWTNNLSKVVG